MTTMTASGARTGTADTPSGPGRRRVDLGPVDFGRVGVVTLFVLTAIANASALVRHLTSDAARWQQVAEVTASLLALSFCALVVRAYLRRERAAASDRGVLVWLVAPLATAVPLAMAAAPTRVWGPVGTSAYIGLTVAGLTISVWALRSLSVNLSVVPQARALVRHGPYRWVRHPLYVGELVALGGLAVHVGRPWVVAVVAGQVVLQLYRAGREERLLHQHLPAYAEYAAGTYRLVPGVW